ncbi:F0F1 ATP synthase subunit epsilon [Rhodopila sp.]|uniref:F0F1 ATP synthase subunit epsilon n=1 Tax=Rhodopila sp. TaxID=2480087 RepID=UPI002D7F2A99|nr:F0F1 ATP synthase subunit epsilon [Rhodopila sp.]
MHLAITTPSAVLMDQAGVLSVRAEDESGGFGILPGHADLLTVLPPSVVRWRTQDRVEHYCVVGGGVLTVTAGRNVSIACRQATLGDNLDELEADVATMRSAEEDTDRRARVAQTRMHAQAVRQLMRYLSPGNATALQTTGASPDSIFGGNAT